jgi:hypothetical protein
MAVAWDMLVMVVMGTLLQLMVLVMVPIRTIKHFQPLLISPVSHFASGIEIFGTTAKNINSTLQNVI